MCGGCGVCIFYVFVLLYTHILICITLVLLLLDMSMVIMDSDMIVRQVSQGHTWCLILSLVSISSSPLCAMTVCPLLTLGNSCLSILC